MGTLIQMRLVKRDTFSLYVKESLQQYFCKEYSNCERTGEKLTIRSKTENEYLRNKKGGKRCVQKNKNEYTIMKKNPC